MRLSIIIPVYNAAKYIQFCLNSILREKSLDMEIICVDDGSTDESLTILETNALTDSRVQVLNQSNEGASSARNRGLDAATGEYICFVDSDDVLDDGFFDVFIQHIELQYSAYFGSQFFNLPNLRPNYVLDRQAINEEAIPIYFQIEQNCSVCNKFYKKSVIDAYNIRFPFGMVFGEDGYFNLSFIIVSDFIMVFESYKYKYVENPTSTTRDISKNNFLKIFIEGRNRYNCLMPLIPIERDLLVYWSSIRMVNNICSVLSLYFRRNDLLSYKERLRMVKEALNDKVVSDVLGKFWDSIIDNRSRFELQVLKAIKKKSMVQLILIFKYVHWRNKID